MISSSPRSTRRGRVSTSRDTSVPRRGIPPPDAVRFAAEIGVRLMYPGRYRELGLDAASARELAEVHRKALQKEYGHEPDTLQEIDGRLTAAWDQGSSGPEVHPNSRRLS